MENLGIGIRLNFSCNFVSDRQCTILNVLINAGEFKVFYVEGKVKNFIFNGLFYPPCQWKMYC